MSPDALDLARALLSADGGPDATSTPERVAAGAARIWERLGRHFARLIGDTGIQAVLDRSVALVAARRPWIAARDGGWSLGAAIQAQPVMTSVEGFGDLVTTFVALLGRFIGDALVKRVLAELWPTVFSIVSKELP